MAENGKNRSPAPDVACAGTHETGTNVAAGDDDASIRARQLAQQRRRWRLIVLASYGFDALILLAFVATGTISLAVPIGYLAAAAAINLPAVLIRPAPGAMRFDDDRIRAFEVVAALLLQFAIVLAEPALAFMVVNVFTVLAFGALRLSVRQFMAAWAVGVAASAVVALRLADSAPSIMPEGLPEAVLTWLFFVSVMGRTVLISSYASLMRLRLSESREALRSTLSEVRDHAIRDDLTGAYNRRYMLHALARAGANGRRVDHPVCILLLDLDSFKSINDRHGHAAGDAVLRRFCEVVARVVRSGDVFGRVGGEEFLLILPGADQVDTARCVDRLRQRLRETDWTDIAPDLSLTASSGIARWAPDDSADTLLARADMALYRAKHAGRDRCEFADPP